MALASVPRGRSGDSCPGERLWEGRSPPSFTWWSILKRDGWFTVFAVTSLWRLLNKVDQSHVFGWGVGLETELNQRIDLRVSVVQWTADDNSQPQTLAEIQQIHPQSKNINVLSSHLLSPQVSEESSQSRQCFFQLKFQMLKSLIPKSSRDYLCSPCENSSVVCFVWLSQELSQKRRGGGRKKYFEVKASFRCGIWRY